MKSKVFCIAILVSSTCLVRSTQADLIINISGMSGSGESTWTFSGSTTATTDGTFQGKNVGNPNDKWIFSSSGLTDTINNTWIINGNLSGITMSIQPSGGSSVDYSLDAVYLDDQAGGDGFSISPGSSNVDFSAGSLISWTGSAVLPVDIGQLTVPSTVATSATLSGARLGISLTAVPEPSGLAALCWIAGALTMVRRRTT